MLPPDDAPCSRPVPHSPPIRLIVNADDFGLSSRINEGIVQAHRQGIVTSTSLMAVGRAFDHAVRCLLDAQALDIGVHLTLVAEQPLLRSISSLAGADGRFLPNAGAFMRRWLTGSIRRSEVEAEWSAQIERVLAQGIAVTHLDSHQHLHILPGLAGLAQTLAARYRIPFIRVPVESPLSGQWTNPHGLSRQLGAMALRAAWSGARIAGATDANRPTIRFLGFHDGGRLNERRLDRLLRTLRPGRTYELMCHPGLRPNEPDVRQWGYDHEGEWRALSRPLLRDEFAAQGIQLCSFADLAKGE